MAGVTERDAVTRPAVIHLELTVSEARVLYELVNRVRGTEPAAQMVWDALRASAKATS